MKQNIILGIAVLALILSGVSLVGGNSTVKLGGTTNYDSLTLSGALTASTVSLSGIATLATTSVTSLCVYNGSNYTKVSFGSNSTSTASFATSSTCL